MTQFFKSKNNNNKYFIYFLILKDNINWNIIKTKLIVTKSLILHDLNYIVNNYENIINNELEYKIIEHDTFTYKFEDEFPKYPYDIFITNRVLLHSFLYFINNNKLIKNILFNEKIHIISNINYLKRIKDWNNNWKKNRYSIEKYQNSSEHIDSIFSINVLSQYYFNIEIESKNNFNCKKMSYEEKSLFERNIERPNTDLIEKCNLYFEDDKLIKFI